MGEPEIIAELSTVHAYELGVTDQSYLQYKLLHVPPDTTVWVVHPHGSPVSNRGQVVAALSLIIDDYAGGTWPHYIDDILKRTRAARALLVAAEPNEEPTPWQESPMAAPRPEPFDDWRKDDRTL